MRAIAHTELENVDLLPSEECSVELVDKAIDKLSYVAARERRKLLLACGACLTADREISLNEAWMIRAICCGLNYPMPEMLPGQPVVAGA